MGIFNNPLIYVIAIVVIAVILILGAVFVLRSGKKKDSTKAGIGGNTDWQRQGQQQQGGAWNQQQGTNNSWSQPGQMQQQQSAGAWNAPNTNSQNSWSGTQQPSGSGWGTPTQQQQQSASNPWGNQGAQQANTPWGSQGQGAQQQQQPAASNPWSTSNTGPQANAPWGGNQGTPQQQQPAASNPWGNQGAQQQQPAWGEAPQPSASPAQDNWAQGSTGSNPSWGAPANPATPMQQSPNAAWNSPQQPSANNPWPGAQPPQQQPAPFQQQGAQGGWQQQSQSGFNQGGFPQQSDATAVYGADSDKTVLRPGGNVAGALGYVRMEEGKEPGRIYEIRKESLSIGRSRESDIFLEDLAVSRLHASLVNLGAGNYALKDEGSANGTKVNGQLVNKFQTYPLQEGDRVQLGQTVLVFGKK